MDRKETKQIGGRRSIAALLTLTGTLLWTVPVVRGTDPGSPYNYRFVRVATAGGQAPGGVGPFVNFYPVDVNKRGDSVFFADIDYGYGIDPGGIYVRTLGRISDIMQMFPYFWYFPVDAAISDNGDVAFAGFELGQVPFGFGGAPVRYSSTRKKLTVIAAPGRRAPGGGTFRGVSVNPSMNNSGEVVFGGIVEGYDIDPSSPPGCNPPKGYYCELRLGVGVFRADRNNKLYKVVKPGDPAPRGRIFDWAGDPWINDGGDVAFGAHLQGDWCNFPDYLDEISCLESVYLRTAGGAIRSIAHQGDPAPGGGAYRSAFGPVVNNRGEVAYLGDLTPPPDLWQTSGVFLYSNDVARAVALPGDNMPGGGKLISASLVRGDYDLNNRGQISFSALLNQDVDHDGLPDSGLYVFTPDSAATADGRRVNGTTKLVVRTSSYIQGVGTVKSASGGMMNDSGRMLVKVTTTAGVLVLLLAIPTA